LIFQKFLPISFCGNSAAINIGETMKFPLHLFIFFTTFLFSIILIAQDVLPPSAAVVTEVDFAKHLFQGIKEEHLKGMMLLATLIQILQMGLRVPFFVKMLEKFSVGRFAVGKYRLVLVLALSWIGGVVYLMSTGLEFIPSLLHSNSVAAWQVLFHQGYKQLSESNPDQGSV
jgi:hypothetical protein